VRSCYNRQYSPWPALLQDGILYLIDENRMTKDVFAKLSLHNPKNFVVARTNMMKQQIRTWDVLDDKILALFYKVHREDYVPKKFRKLAYADTCIPLGHGLSMMTPKEEARILQDLQIKNEDKALILGADSGYLIALLSRLAREVLYVNNDLDFFDEVKEKITAEKLPNVKMKMGGINYGWQDSIPFDVILLTGSVPTVPEDLKNALTLQGRLFSVVGKPPAMEAILMTRLSETTWDENKLFETDRPRMLDIKEPDTFVF
jgi:protein-L-isoaspartate(D-aspartate) O-methyltransferase